MADPQQGRGTYEERAERVFEEIKRAEEEGGREAAVQVLVGALKGEAVHVYREANRPSKVNEVARSD